MDEVKKNKEYTSRELAQKIRILSLEMVYRARASHIASALSICDIVATLYSDILRYDPKNPEWAERDRFILSKGHACVAVYAALAEVGFFCIDELKSYGQDHSMFMNHISHKVPGVEFSTGSLGHGLPFAVGKAFAAKKCGHKWRTFALLSDGEMAEGSNWEAILFAGYHRLNNLIAILDYNKLQSLTSVANTLNIEPLSQKLTAFGWNVLEVPGHDCSKIYKTLNTVPETNDAPTFVIAHTTKGSGVSFMENQVLWHYKSPSDYELKMAITEILDA